MRCKVCGETMANQYRKSGQIGIIEEFAYCNKKHYSFNFSNGVYKERFGNEALKYLTIHSNQPFR